MELDGVLEVLIQYREWLNISGIEAQEICASK